MAKKDHSRVEALKQDWRKASESERDEFVQWVGQETRRDIEELTQTLYSQSEQPASPPTSS